MSVIEIEALEVEHYRQAFGIGHTRPRLSWRYALSTAKGWIQRQYEITINVNDKDSATYRVNSGQNTLVPWPHSPLKARDKATVSVRAQGLDGLWTESVGTTLTVSLLAREDWTGEFITGPPQPGDRTKDVFGVVHSFEVSSPIKGAHLYSTALGLYTVFINGKRVGTDVLAPGWTTYSSHLNSQVYDVTSLLQLGTNTIGAQLAEGWYAARLGGGKGIRNVWGDRLGFLAQIEVKDRVLVQTDQSWKWTRTPILVSSIYDGETFDSRQPRMEWLNVKLAEGQVEILPFPSATIAPTMSPPVRKIMEVKPVDMRTTPSGKLILDFGQNLVGWLRINKSLTGQRGQEMILRHADVLENGELGARPLCTAKCTDTVLLGGETKDWEPSFTFHGFRYVEITGIETAQIDLNTFTAIVISSDLRPTGTFQCSHDAINRLHKNVEWGMRSNFISVPTDCPQRDERLGWTGDIQVFGPTAHYLADTSGFLASWMKDVAVETMYCDGIVPITVPHPFYSRSRPTPHAIWSDCMVLTPWQLYQTYGDIDILAANWEAMQAWVDRGLPRDKDGMWDRTTKLYGDWLDPKAPPQYPAHGLTDAYYCANAYLVHVTRVIAKIARLLGHTIEAERYVADAKDLLSKFRAEYVSPNGRLVADTQTGIALALEFDLLEPVQVAHAVERLEYLIRWNYFKITTGFAGTPIILRVLAKYGKTNLAYRMLQERDNPSWLYPVTMGATTIWERWDSMLEDGSINPGSMTSFNHYALGSVANFLHATVAGLAPGETGWKQAVVRPIPGGTITSASASYSSPIGKYSVSWSIIGSRFHLEVKVPPNGSAKVFLRNGEVKVGSGHHRFSEPYQGEKNWPPQGIQGPQSRVMPDRYIP